MRVDDDFSVDSRSQQQNSSVFFSAVSFVLALQRKMITTRNGFFNLPDGFSIKMPSEAGGWCGLLCWSLQPTVEQLFLTRTSSVMLAGQVRKKKKKRLTFAKVGLKRWMGILTLGKVLFHIGFYFK